VKLKKVTMDIRLEKQSEEHGNTCLSEAYVKIRSYISIYKEKPGKIRKNQKNGESSSVESCWRRQVENM
jgi:hypothetical protein